VSAGTSFAETWRCPCIVELTTMVAALIMSAAAMAWSRGASQQVWQIFNPVTHPLAFKD
jgi:hypothetical protein